MITRKILIEKVKKIYYEKSWILLNDKEALDESFRLLEAVKLILLNGNNQ